MITEVALADRSAWMQWWSATGREPFAHPDYVRLFARADDHIALLLVDEQAGGAAILPIVRRPLPPNLDAGDHGDMWTDAVSPYGYGGPYGAGEVDWRSFYGKVLAWMQREHVVTCFVRAALHSDQPLSGPGHPNVRGVVLADNVVVDCTRSDEEQWVHYAHKVRKNVKKATRAQLRVRVSERLDDVDGFLDVYRATMDRRGADDRYYFDEEFFSNVGRLPGCVRVFEVLDPSGRTVSSELVLVSDRFFYSFLGGTREEAFVHAPNDLLKHAVIEQARAEGKDGYVLGGGYAPGDGIFRYKASFDQDGVVPFFGIQLTANTDLYSILVARANGARSSTNEPTSYFPAYRR